MRVDFRPTEVAFWPVGVDFRLRFGFVLWESRMGLRESILGILKSVFEPLGVEFGPSKVSLGPLEVNFGSGLGGFGLW